MVAAAVIGAGVLGAGASIYGANKAADQQSAAANQASQNTMDMFNRTRADVAPWMASGTLALGALTKFMGLNPDGSMDPNAPGVKPFTVADLPTDPGYQFRLQQGEDAIMNQKSAMGGVLSGATLKDLTGFAQGTASDEFNNAWLRHNTDNSNIVSRLMAISGTGANAASGIAGTGMQAAGIVSNNLTGAANATAAGTVASTNALTGGISSLYNNYMMSQILAQNRGMPQGYVMPDPSVMNLIMGPGPVGGT